MVDVSVVIPAYRAAGFIGRAIRSALAQEGVSLEVIVVDDACPLDSAGSVQAEFGGRDEVRVIRLGQNGGPSAARTAGFRAARGEWIAVLDADDAYLPGRLALLVSQGRDRKADVVADDVLFYDAVSGQTGGPNLKSISTPRLINAHEFVDRCRPGSGELDFGLLKPIFRSAFVQPLPELYPAEIRHGEDFHFYFALLRQGAVFLVLPGGGYLWTQRNSGQSQTRADYLGQAAHARALRASVLDGDARLAALLEARAVALTDLHHRNHYQAARNSRRPLEAAAVCLRHPPLLLDRLAALRRRLRHALGG
ncbi:glycosyltransferase family 2 protein [Rubrivivax gelatinosus]|uniref:Glycosyltransferase 2-like domain-containing protein n=1 Tax=Rubrivivax gelatinosus TaxID=28068 RepID=A0ABS1DZ67_RUBGE|nr:glycosyltransferase family 2 protein [Rubrivivax gelatinosus]MBK1715401.1 hypothetical protein [Rubrivivax gelatinosus]